MSALEVFQSNLIHEVAPPVTDANGGTSIGDPAAGSGPNGGRGGGGDASQGKLGDWRTREITTADRAGAGILTTLFLAGLVGCTSWMIYEK